MSNKKFPTCVADFLKEEHFYEIGPGMIFGGDWLVFNTVKPSPFQTMTRIEGKHYEDIYESEEAYILHAKKFYNLDIDAASMKKFTPIYASDFHKSLHK